MTHATERPLGPCLADEAQNLAQGDLAALGRIFDLCSERLLRYARTLTGNPYDAEDAVQSAMIAIAKHPQSLAAAEAPWPYFLVVVRNEANRLLQRRRTGHLLVDSPAADDGSDSAADEEVHELIRRAVRRLPPEQAEVVLLKIWEHMTFIEIANVVGESPNTVASRYRYAIEKLSRSLQSLRAEGVTHDR